MINRSLTGAQRLCLQFIERHIAEVGMAPTLREIQTGLNYASVTSAADHVQTLADKGCISYLPGKARSIRISTSQENAA